MNTITLSKSLPVKGHYDVIVCGGGVAGCAAAISAAKRGMSTLLIEKANILGGLATLGQINLFVPMCNGRGKQIIFGLCEKWVRDSAKYGYDTLPKPWQNGAPDEPTDVRYINWFSPYIFTLQLTEDVLAAGVQLLFDCIATEPVMQENTVQGVITYGKGGAEYYTCARLIDTTGDMDVLRAGGVPYTAGRNFATYTGKMITLDNCRRAASSGHIRDAYTTIAGYDASLWGDRQPPQLPRWSGLSAEEVTDYIITNQHVMLQRLKDSDRNERDVAMLPLMPQFRTTCHLNGDHTFRYQDVYCHFDDAVCAINDFEHRDYLYEVPLRTLCRHDYPNVLTAGRSACADDYGWDVLRVIPPAILTGQAAAEAACLSLERGCTVADVPIHVLQERMEAANVMVHFPDDYVPEDKTIHLKDGRVEIFGGHL